MPVKFIRDRLVGELQARTRAFGGPFTPWANVAEVDFDSSSLLTTETNFPNYRYRIRKKLSATTSLTFAGYEARTGSPCSISAIQQHKFDGALRFETEYRGYPGVISLEIPTNFAGVDRAQVDALVMQGIIAKANRELRSLQGIVAFGELRETLSMIRHPLRSFHDGLKGYLVTVRNRTRGLSRLPRNKRLPGARRVISDTWLENAFGWQPLVNDIHGALQGAARVLTYREPTKYIQFKGGTSNLISFGRSDISTGPQNHWIQRDYSTRGEYQVKMYGVVKCTSGGDVDSFKKAYGFQVSDLVPSLWELIPWSFLVDYFTNIGAMIEAASFNRSNLAWLNRGEMQRITFISNSTLHSNLNVAGPFDSDPANWTNDVAGDISGAPFRVAKVFKSRSKYEGSLVPELVFTIPGLNMKWLNMAALLSNSKHTSRSINRVITG